MLVRLALSLTASAFMVLAAHAETVRTSLRAEGMSAWCQKLTLHPWRG
jgi:hypothetical protein